MFVTVLSLDIILKFSKTVILEFSDSFMQILVFLFFVPEKQLVGCYMQTKYFLDNHLNKGLICLCKRYFVMHLNRLEEQTAEMQAYIKVFNSAILSALLRLTV